MTEMAPEHPPLPEGEGAPTELEVKVEGSVVDGVFTLDYGVEDMALITLRFGRLGSDIIPALLQAIAETWDAALENIIEQSEHQQLQAEAHQALAAVQEATDGE